MINLTMMEDISVFMMDPTYVDFEVYDLWLKGFTGKGVGLPLLFFVLFCLFFFLISLNTNSIFYKNETLLILVCLLSVTL